MFKEAVRNPAGGTLGGEFRHGPMEMVREGFYAVVFATKGKTLWHKAKCIACKLNCDPTILPLTAT